MKLRVSFALEVLFSRTEKDSLYVLTIQLAVPKLDLSEANIIKASKRRSITFEFRLQGLNNNLQSLATNITSSYTPGEKLKALILKEADLKYPFRQDST